MKFLVFSMMIFGLSSNSIAAPLAKCPEQSKEIYLCESKPKKGDHEVAASTFDSIAVCKQNESTLLVFEKNNESESTVANVSSRAGGTTYTVETEDTDFSLSVTTGTRFKTNSAKFSINLKAHDLQMSSTYSCK
jgi:hypothetical protein